MQHKEDFLLEKNKHIEEVQKNKPVPIPERTQHFKYALGGIKVQIQKDKTNEQQVFIDKIRGIPAKTIVFDVCQTASNVSNHEVIQPADQSTATLPSDTTCNKNRLVTLVKNHPPERKRREDRPLYVPPKRSLSSPSKEPPSHKDNSIHHQNRNDVKHNNQTNKNECNADANRLDDGKWRGKYTKNQVNATSLVYRASEPDKTQSIRSNTKEKDVDGITKDVSFSKALKSEGNWENCDPVKNPVRPVEKNFQRSASIPSVHKNNAKYKDDFTLKGTYGTNETERCKNISGSWEVDATSKRYPYNIESEVVCDKNQSIRTKSNTKVTSDNWASLNAPDTDNMDGIWENCAKVEHKVGSVSKNSQFSNSLQSTCKTDVECNADSTLESTHRQNKGISYTNYPANVGVSSQPKVYRCNTSLPEDLSKRTASQSVATKTKEKIDELEIKKDCWGPLCFEASDNINLDGTWGNGVEVENNASSVTKNYQRSTSLPLTRNTDVKCNSTSTSESTHRQNKSTSYTNYPGNIGVISSLTFNSDFFSNTV